MSETPIVFGKWELGRYVPPPMSEEMQEHVRRMLERDSERYTRALAIFGADDAEDPE